MPADPFVSQPVGSGLLLVALLIASYLYAALLRRRHADEASRERSLHSIVDNYGRSGLP